MTQLHFLQRYKKAVMEKTVVNYKHAHEKNSDKMTFNHFITICRLIRCDMIILPLRYLSGLLFL